MNYTELIFTVDNTGGYERDLLIDSLGGIGFDTFEETEQGFKAYIPQQDFDEIALEEALGMHRSMFDFAYESNLIPQKNWNEEWESNFEPIEITDQVFVRATFHEARPDFPYEIVIDPKMAFGTGHHQTTAMMMELMLSADFKGKKVLDMGCGTGILAILAEKLGATDLLAIDYDPVCYESTIENAALNHADHVKALCGSKEVIPAEQYDIILANINRNILINQMERYAEVLKAGGEIYFSGFYEEPDLQIIKDEAGKYGLKYITHLKNKDWVAARFNRA